MMEGWNGGKAKGFRLKVGGAALRALRLEAKLGWNDGQAV